MFHIDYFPRGNSSTGNTNPPPDLSGYVTKEELANYISEYVTKEELSNLLPNMSEIETKTKGWILGSGLFRRTLVLAPNQSGIFPNYTLDQGGWQSFIYLAGNPTNELVVNVSIPDVSQNGTSLHLCTPWTDTSPFGWDNSFLPPGTNDYRSPPAGVWCFIVNGSVKNASIRFPSGSYVYGLTSNGTVVSSVSGNLRDDQVEPGRMAFIWCWATDRGYDGKTGRYAYRCW